MRLVRNIRYLFLIYCRTKIITELNFHSRSTTKKRKKKNRKKKLWKASFKISWFSSFFSFCFLAKLERYNRETKFTRNQPSYRTSIWSTLIISCKECTMKYFSRIKLTIISVYFSINGTDRTFRRFLSTLP